MFERPVQLCVAVRHLLLSTVENASVASPLSGGPSMKNVWLELVMLTKPLSILSPLLRVSLTAAQSTRTCRMYYAPLLSRSLAGLPFNHLRFAWRLCTTHSHLHSSCFCLRYLQSARDEDVEKIDQLHSQTEAALVGVPSEAIAGFPLTQRCRVRPFRRYAVEVPFLRALCNSCCEARKDRLEGSTALS